MTAPTTRETADHAELKRLAEAATRGDWRAHITTKRSPEIYTNVPPPNTPNPKIAGAILRKADARFIAAANPARVLSLLSEIAALRGDLTVSRDDLDQLQAHFRQRDREATQAERQRDELRKALEGVISDCNLAASACDNDGPRAGFQHIANDARQALANQGADQ